MVIDKQWLENVKLEVQQQERDSVMQARGAMAVVEAAIKYLAEQQAEQPETVEE